MLEVAEVGVFNVGNLCFADQGTDIGGLESSTALTDTEGCIEDGVGRARSADSVVILAVFAIGAAQVSFNNEVSEAPGCALDIESNSHHLGFVHLGRE